MPEHRSWRDAIRFFGHPQVRSMLFLGFSSGLPLMLVFGSLSFWLREAGVDRSTIGFVSWVALAYAFKWVWSPLVDRLSLPFLGALLGRRRSWMLLSQLAVMFGLLGMALSDPQQGLAILVGFALFVAFASATQDIVIDAYRIESVEPDLQGIMAAGYILGYRLAMMLATAGVLGIAAWADPDASQYEYVSWMVAYCVMSATMLVGILTTLLIREPSITNRPETLAQQAKMAASLQRFAHFPNLMQRVISWLLSAVVGPFADFLRRYGWHAVLLLALISSYRISDIVLGVISNVFYVDMGFTKGEVATITKVFGVIMTLVGSAMGGLMVARFGVMRILFLGAVLSAATNLLFALLATVGNDLTYLTLVISADNLGAGVATAAFVAYLSSLTNVAYSATQYALFSSVMLLLPKFLGGYSGVMVDGVGYPSFFILTALMGLPVMLLIIIAARRSAGSGHNA